jgi:hypothetical protein
MNISYRTKLLLRRIFSISAMVLVVAITVTVCSVVWLQRFVVYTDDGAKLVFDQPKRLPQAQLPGQAYDPAITIHYSDQPFREGLPQLAGYYIDPQDLMKDPEAVRQKLEQLPAGTAVLLDVKGYRGYFYYSTAVGRNTSSSYDIDKMDELIRWLAGSDLYVIARMSALRDFDVAWNDKSCGLAKTNGALYADEGRYGLGYWLDPTDDTVLRYLTQVLRELRDLGFDEVVLDNFRYPNTDKLAFKGDRDAALQEAAAQLMAACVNEHFAISFSSSNASYVLPEGRCRLFLEGIDPEDAQSAWDNANVEDKRLNLVFLAEKDDSRYQIENGILLPLP